MEALTSMDANLRFICMEAANVRAMKRTITINIMLGRFV